MGTIKRKVDWFSHDCKPGRTLGILQSLYGNNGYAFWYKLLELLGDSEGHFYDASNRINWLHLVSYAVINEGVVVDIMSTLCDLEAIDRELWETSKIIWCQKLVDRLSALYSRRKDEAIPTRPPLKPINAHIEAVDVDIETQNVDGERQSKVKDRIVKERIEVRRAALDDSDLLGSEDDQPTAPKKTKQPRSLAVVRFHELTDRWPNSIQIKAIDENVITDADVDTWELVIKSWLMRGFSPVGVEGMLEWFRTGIPPRKGNNGQRPETPVAGKDDLEDWKEIENKQRERMKRSGGGGEIKP